MLTNKQKTYIKKLHQKKYREEYGAFIVEGKKGVQEVLKSNWEIEFLIILDKNNFLEIIEKAKEKNIEILEIKETDVEQIKTTKTFSGIMAIVKKRVDLNYELGDTVLFLDNISDPGNLGTIIRTADWFGIKNIILSANTVDEYNDKVVRSSMGSMFHINLQKTKNDLETIKSLKKQNYKICTLDLSGENLEKSDFPAKAVYILGNESHGIRQEITNLSDLILKIDGQGSAESLNVAIAGGILLHSISTKK